MELRCSTPKIEGILQVSKWLKSAVLLDVDEMKDLFNALGSIYFFNVSQPVTPLEERFTTAQFIEIYERYVETLKQGGVPLIDLFRAPFSSALSATQEYFYALKLASGKALVKPTKPVIQLQAHYFFYSALDGKFHSMVQGSDSISWGIQFSYPQLFQDPHTRKVVKVTEQEEFVNTSIFSTLMQWIRSHTLPTPFLVNGVRTNSPIRIGKKALSWVGSHAELKQKKIEIFPLLGI